MADAAAVALAARAGSRAPPLNEELLEELFGKASTDEGDNFLKSYIARQAWDEDAEDNQVPHHQQVQAGREHL